MQRLVAARLPICLGLLCTVLAFSISYQHRNSATIADTVHADHGADAEAIDLAALHEAALKNDRAGEEAALHLLQKRIMTKEALQLRNTVGRLEKEKAMLKEEVARSKKEAEALNKQASKKEVNSHRVDRAKEEVIAERKSLDAESRIVQNEAEALKKAEELTDKIGDKLEKEEEALSKHDLASAKMYKTRLSNLQERASKRLDDFYNEQREQKRKEAKVAEVANSWAHIKAVQGASPNIVMKHGKEEDRHRNTLKQAAKLEAKEVELEEIARQLMQRKAELDKRVDEAAASER